MVDIFDLVLVGMNFLKSGVDMTGDTNLDQVVDLYDLVTVAKHFGETYDSIISTAPKMLEVHAPVKVSMTAKHSISGDDDLSEQLLKLEVSAVMQTLITGYQLDLTYDPRLLTVVGFEKGNLLGARSFHLDPQMTLGRIGSIAATQLGDSVGEGMAQSTMVSVSFRLKGDLDLALKSIKIRNLAIVNQQLQQVPVVVKGVITADLDSAPVSRFSLGQNYPNPFNPETWIPYQLASAETVVVEIYDAAGHLVRRFNVGWQRAGDYTSRGRSVYWDGRNEFGEQMASGVYYYTINAGDFLSTSKMLLLK